MSEDLNKKFVESVVVDGWEVLGEDGFVDIVTAHKTIPYALWGLKTETHSLKCADKHIVFREGERGVLEECFVDALSVGDKIMTESGKEAVVELTNYKRLETMYDLQVNSFNQSYYTDGILSHNTATAALYLLWYAMFTPDTNILIAAHKGSGADEIMKRIRYSYEECPDYIRAGVTTWASKTIVFDNHSSITAQTTTENTGRGLSISLLYCLDAGTRVTVRDSETKEEKVITLESLYTELANEELVKIEKINMMRLFFDGGYYMDVPEDQSLLVNDVKTIIELVTHGDEVLVNNSYYKVVDIDVIE